MIIVTGVGRSGTSITTKVLAEITRYDLDARWEDSVNAGLEHSKVVQLNSKLIQGQTCGTDFDSSLVIDRAEQWEHDIAFVVKQLYNDDTWIVKDPRFCYSLDVWLHVCEHFRVEEVDDFFTDLEVVVCTRNATDVMLSVQDTGAGMPELQRANPHQIYGEIFNRYNNLMRILSHFGKAPNFVRYEHFKEDINAVAKNLNLNGHSVTGYVDTIVDENFNGPKTRH
jgi:hypothetical protein